MGPEKNLGLSTRQCALEGASPRLRDTDLDTVSRAFSSNADVAKVTHFTITLCRNFPAKHPGGYCKANKG